jgi:hypothetical protein
MADAGWNDVLRRAQGMRRRCRLRTTAVSLAAAVAALVGALAAGGQIGSFLSHSNEPHLLLRAQLRTPQGGFSGNIEIELGRAAVVITRDGPRVRPWIPSSGRFPGGVYPTRWFLRLRTGAGGTLSVGGRTLCDRCRSTDSGRIELLPAAAAALIAGRDRAVYSGGNATARGTVVLVRSRLHRGLVCTQVGTGTRCGRIFIGR